MKIAADKLERDLKQKLLPVYLVAGDEPLTNGEAADAIRAAARSQGFEEREVHFIDRSTAWDEILGSAQALSLFSSRRILEIRMPGGKPGHGAKTLLQIIAAAGPDLLVLILTGRLDRDSLASAWAKAAQAAGGWIELGDIPTSAFPDWIRARARTLGLTLEDEAVALLATQTEGNLLAAYQELQKLRLAGIDRADAAQLTASVTSSSRFDVTQVGEAVLAGDTVRTLRVLASLRSEGTEPTLVLWAILQEMRNLWVNLVKGPPIGGVWTKNSAQVGRAMERFRQGSGRALFARLNERASRADRMIKGRLGGDAWDEITLLALELAGSRALPLPRRA